jgi:hypothetical protein
MADSAPPPTVTILVNGKEAIKVDLGHFKTLTSGKVAERNKRLYFPLAGPGLSLTNRELIRFFEVISDVEADLCNLPGRDTVLAWADRFNFDLLAQNLRATHRGDAALNNLARPVQFSNEDDDAVPAAIAAHLPRILVVDNPSQYLSFRPRTLRRAIEKALLDTPEMRSNASDQSRRTGLIAAFVNCIIPKLDSDPGYSEVFAGVDFAALSIEQLLRVFSCQSLDVSLIGARGFKIIMRQFSETREILQRTQNQLQGPFIPDMVQETYRQWEDKAEKPQAVQIDVSLKALEEGAKALADRFAPELRAVQSGAKEIRARVAASGQGAGERAAFDETVKLVEELKSTIGQLAQVPEPILSPFRSSPQSRLLGVLRTDVDSLAFQSPEWEQPVIDLEDHTTLGDFDGWSITSFGRENPTLTIEFRVHGPPFDESLVPLRHQDTAKQQVNRPAARVINVQMYSLKAGRVNGVLPYMTGWRLWGRLAALPVALPPFGRRAGDWVPMDFQENNFILRDGKRHDFRLLKWNGEFFDGLKLEMTHRNSMGHKTMRLETFSVACNVYNADGNVLRDADGDRIWPWTEVFRRSRFRHYLGGPFICPNDYHHQHSIAETLDMLTRKSQTHLTINPMDALQALKSFNKLGVKCNRPEQDLLGLREYNRALFLVNGLGSKSHVPDPKSKSHKIAKAIDIFCKLANSDLDLEWVRRAAVNCAALLMRREGLPGINDGVGLALLSRADDAHDPVAADNLWLLFVDADDPNRLRRSALAGFAPALMTLARQSPEERFVFCKWAAQIGYLPAKFSYSYYSRIASQQFRMVAEPCFVSDPVCFDLFKAQLEDQNLDPALCLPPRQWVPFDAAGKAPLSEKQPGEGRPSYELLRKVTVTIAAHYEQRPHGRLNPDAIYWSNDDVSFCPPDYMFDTKFDFYADNDVANGCEPTTSSDVFSFAILAYGLLFRRELLTGRPDRWGSLPVFGFASIGGRPIIPKNLGPTIRSIIRCCWASDPTHRPPNSEGPGRWRRQPIRGSRPPSQQPAPKGRAEGDIKLALFILVPSMDWRGRIFGLRQINKVNPHSHKGRSNRLLDVCRTGLIEFLYVSVSGPSARRSFHSAVS